MTIIKIQSNKFKRFKILLAVYEKCEQDTQIWCDVRELSSMENIKNGDFEKSYQYLIDENLLMPHGEKFTAHITHAGIKAVEFTIENPTQKSEYFSSFVEMGL